jgi:hypothetical protein
MIIIGECKTIQFSQKELFFIVKIVQVQLKVQNSAVDFETVMVTALK